VTVNVPFSLTQPDSGSNRRPSTAANRKMSTMSTDSTYYPMHVAVREWQRIQREEEQSRKARQKNHQNENCGSRRSPRASPSSGVMAEAVFDPLVEVEEVSSATSRKETSFSFSFKRKSISNSSKQRQLRFKQQQSVEGDPSPPPQLQQVQSPPPPPPPALEEQTLMSNGRTQTTDDEWL
jgi:hypothetical protein